MKGGTQMPGVNTQKIAAALGRESGKILMLADGFVDEVWEVISSRASLGDFTTFSQMAQFAQRIASSGTGGVGLELARKRRAVGGFTVNIGHAAARLGVDTAMIGVYGKEKVDPIFGEVAALCRMISLGDPAVTHVFEFDDGKILLSHMEAVQDISWQRIVDRVGVEELISMLVRSDIIGVGYMSLLPAFDEITEQVCAHLPRDGKPRRLFFDFADFRKKDRASLDLTMQRLRALSEKCPMTLSVNEHEGAALFAICGETLDDEGRSIREKTEDVRKQTGFDELVIHAPHYAVAASAGEPPAFAPSAFCAKPLRVVGAGDSFNGGYLAASLAGLGLAGRLQVANAAVGYFLRNAEFPGLEDVLRQLDV